MYMYIAACQGQTTPGDKILMSTETSCQFGHLLQFSRKKKKSLKSDFIQFLYMYIAPRQGLTTLCGHNFDVNKNLSLRSFVASFKKFSLKSDFIQFFFFMIFIHVYSPGARVDSPQGTKL